MKNIKALYIIINAGFSEEIIDIVREKGATGATIINARGSVANPQTFLGITIDKEKEIILSVIKKEVGDEVIKAVQEKMGNGTPANAVCFYLPVEMTTLEIK